MELLFGRFLKTDGKSEICSKHCFCFPTGLMSPSDNLKVTQAKMQEYQDNGARLGWLINRKDREVEVYRVGKIKEVLQNPSSLSGEDVLPEFILSLAEIW